MAQKARKLVKIRIPGIGLPALRRNLLCEGVSGFCVLSRQAGDALDSLFPEELEQYRAELEARLQDMDDDEPEDMAGEEFEQWADAHESLEDLLSEAEDRMDELV